MLESKTYQRQRERILREATIENTLALLKRRFHTEEVGALTPALQNIEANVSLQAINKEFHSTRSSHIRWKVSKTKSYQALTPFFNDTT